MHNCWEYLVYEYLASSNVVFWHLVFHETLLHWLVMTTTQSCLVVVEVFMNHFPFHSIYFESDNNGP